MSIFSKKKKVVEQEKSVEADANKPKPAPYFHTPTHAARDFLSSTPPSFTGQHRASMMQQNRNSLMTRSMGDRIGRATTSGASTPIQRSSSQISSSSSLMADYPPVVTVQRTRPNPFLSASAQPNFEPLDEVPPMPAIPHRYSSPVVPKVENKVMASQRPFSTSQKPAYVRSPLSTSSNSPVESDDTTPASSTHSSISAHAPQLEMKKVWDNGQEVFRTYAKTPIHQISEMSPPVPAPAPVSEMSRQQQAVKSGAQAKEPAVEKREKKRKSLFGLGGRKSAVAAN